ncbi:MAG: DUF1840 domain-containing protein [Thioalkalivibrio sp.]
MLITFKTPAHGDLTFFGGVAMELIRLMGHSGSVPGALAQEDVPMALTRLREAMASAEGETRPPLEDDEEDPDETPVPLRNRAQPLITLLQAAADAGSHVIWEQG